MFQVQTISDGSLVDIGTQQNAPAQRTLPNVRVDTPCPPMGQPAISSGIFGTSTFFRLCFLEIGFPSLVGVTGPDGKLGKK